MDDSDLLGKIAYLFNDGYGIVKFSYNSPNFNDKITIHLESDKSTLFEIDPIYYNEKVDLDNRKIILSIDQFSDYTGDISYEPETIEPDKIQVPQDIIDKIKDSKE